MISKKEVYIITLSTESKWHAMVRKVVLPMNRQGKISIVEVWDL